jgi:hypothetical protein
MVKLLVTVGVTNCLSTEVLSTLMMNQVHALAEQLHGEVQALNSSSSMRAPSSHGRGLPDKHQQHEEEALEDGDEQWPGSSKGKQKGKQGGGLQVKYNNTRGFYLVIPQPTDKNGNPQDVRLPRYACKPRPVSQLQGCTMPCMHAALLCSALNSNLELSAATTGLLCTLMQVG